MSKMTNSERKSVVTISVGAWIRAQREGQLKVSLASKLSENGYSQNAAYGVAKRIINALKDEGAIHISKSGQLTLKRRLDAEYIGDLCDKIFGKVYKPKPRDISQFPITTPTPTPEKVEDAGVVKFEASGNLVRVHCTEDIWPMMCDAQRIVAVRENCKMQEWSRQPILQPSLKSFKDEELVAELRKRGWDVKCKRTQVIEL